MAGRTTAMESFMVKPVVLAEARTLTDSDSGKTYFLNAAAGFQVTLPAPRAGLNFEFILKTAPSTGHYVIGSRADEKIIRGKQLTSNLNAETNATWEKDGASNIRFIMGQAAIGDSVELISDGTYWYALGFTSIWDAFSIVEDSKSPSISPSRSLSVSPSKSPSISPSASVSVSVSISPSISPSRSPSRSPSESPSPS